jgi:type II secretory pathway component PulF
LCEADLNHAIRSVPQFIEPAMICVLGLIIGGVALAMLLPIFQISRVMTQ